MTNAFGIEHEISKAGLEEVTRLGVRQAFRLGRNTRAALEGQRASGEVTGSAFRSAKQAQGRFNTPVEGQGTRSFPERAAQHVGFHRNAYLMGAGAAKETAAVGAGAAAWNQRKKRKAMQAAGLQAPPDTSYAPVIGALTKSAFGIEHGRKLP
jgi:hypothetical protein